MPDAGRAQRPVIDVELRPEGERDFAAIVSLRGEHDLATADEVSGALNAIDGNVLIDLSDCSFLDSTVIDFLFARNLDLELVGRSLEVVVPRVNAGVARTLELVRMHDAIVVRGVRPSRDRESSTGLEQRPGRSLHTPTVLRRRSLMDGIEAIPRTSYPTSGSPSPSGHPSRARPSSREPGPTAVPLALVPPIS